jgi:hypothetical protein
VLHHVSQYLYPIKTTNFQPSSMLHRVNTKLVTSILQECSTFIFKARNTLQMKAL